MPIGWTSFVPVISAILYGSDGIPIFVGCLYDLDHRNS